MSFYLVSTPACGAASPFPHPCGSHTHARTGGTEVWVSWKTAVREYQSVVVRTTNAFTTTLVPVVGGTNDMVSAVRLVLSVWATPQVPRIWPRLGAVMSPPTEVGLCTSQPRK